MALRLGKPGIASRTLADVVGALRQRRIVLQDLDEISLWIDGRTATNPTLEARPYVAGVTVPGDAVEGYSA